MHSWKRRLRERRYNQRQMYVRRGLGAIGSPVTTIANTIQQVEGYYPGTLAYRNNNPGNLIYVGQAGATPGAGGFAAFPTYDDGYNALLKQIQNYANRGLTIQQMMDIYAPASQPGNDPTLYANKLAASLGVTTDTTLADALAGGGSGGGPDTSGELDLSVFGDPSTADPVMLGVAALALGLLAYSAL